MEAVQIHQQGAHMEKVRAVPRREGISKQRQAELEAKAELYLSEACEYLGWKPQTFYNRRSMAAKNDTPWIIPQGHRDSTGALVFSPTELKAFKLKNRAKA